MLYELNKIELELVQMKHRLRSLLTNEAHNNAELFNIISDVYNGAFESVGNEFRAFLLRSE